MTDTLAVELLPKQSSTPFELAHLGAMIEAWPVDVDAVRRESDPMLCDVANLPFLAFDRGLTLWSDDWTETRKRTYVRDAWIYKRLEGTPLGVEAYLNLADSVVIREVLPPAESFAIEDTGLTNAQVLAVMPQLRLYYHFPEKAFPQTAAFADRACADWMFAYPDQGEALGRYPVIYDPKTGVETPLDVVSYDEVGTDVVLSYPGYAGTGLYADCGCADVSFAGTPLIEAPITYSIVSPDLETVRDAPPMQRWEFVGDFGYADRMFAMPDLGAAGTYDRLYIYDPSRLTSAVGIARNAFYADWSWIGIPNYTEILTVAVPGTPAARALCIADGRRRLRAR